MKQLKAFIETYRDGIGFILRFALYFTAAQLLYFAVRSHAAPFLIDIMHVRPAAWLINTFTSTETCRAVGDTISDGPNSMAVFLGCEGTESLILIVAAMFAYRAPLRNKATGMLLGLAIVYAANLARLIGLFYTVKYRPSFFDTAHMVIGQSFIILTGVAYFIWWSSFTLRREADR